MKTLNTLYSAGADVVVPKYLVGSSITTTLSKRSPVVQSQCCTTERRYASFQSRRGRIQKSEGSTPARNFWKILKLLVRWTQSKSEKRRRSYRGEGYGLDILKGSGASIGRKLVGQS